MTATKTQMKPPPPGSGKKTVAGFSDDEIRELAHRISQLSAKDAQKLSGYLADLGIIEYPERHQHVVSPGGMSDEF